MATQAKLLFVDLQCNTEGGCGCGGEDNAWCPCSEYEGGLCPANGFLYPPEDLAEHYLAPLYNLGARINTNSWGSDCATGDWCSGDDSHTRDVDDFIYEHDDMLVLFAAGNDGDEVRILI
jgi:hypothetical protein